LFGTGLGSTAKTYNAATGATTELRYHPWGGTRFSSGTTPTARRYTGQIEDAAIGLYPSATSGQAFYNARYYDSALGRFIQADTIVPSPANPQSLNRYAYVLNNPLRYTDPTGHMTDEELEDVLGADWEYYLRLWEKYDPYWAAILRALKSGDKLTATLLQGELHFEKIKGVMHAILNNGDAGNLLEWQGQGFYNIDRPGKSARDNALSFR